MQHVASVPLLQTVYAVGIPASAVRSTAGSCTPTQWGDRVGYEIPGATLTLQQGLFEHYAVRDDLVPGRGAAHQAREFFWWHDVGHVVFGGV